jgi:hypothetical protein
MAEPDLARVARRRRIVGGALVATFAAVLIAIVVVRGAGEKVLNENGETLVLVGKEDSKGTDELDAFVAEVGGCLGVVDREGATKVVVWPHGTTIKTPLPLRVTVDGDTYATGQGITLRGEVATLEPSGYFYDKVPKACRASEVFVAGHGNG